MRQTRHGENIAGQIQTADAYGAFNPLNITDLWAILDNLETHFIDYPQVNYQPEMLKLIAEWKESLVSIDNDVLDAI